jgi:acid phosphatase (class A)
MKKTLISLIFLISNCALAHAYLAKPYFDVAIINPTLLDKSVALDSDERKDEIQQIIKLQKNPNAVELKQAIEEEHLKSEHVLLAVEPEMTRAKFPKTYDLLDRVLATAGAASSNAKNYWKIKRPFLTDKKIKLLVSSIGIGELSYPSGHTTASYAMARVCALLIPQKSEEFFARANKIAEHRVLVGAHFPTDLKGGRQMALLVVGGLLQNAEFQKDFAAVKKELAK